MKKKLWVVLMIIFSPLILVFGLLYKLKRYVRSGKNTKIVLEDIVAGFTNYEFPSPHIEKMANIRAKICSQCEFAKYSGAVNTFTVGEKITHIKGMYCDACGCGLSAKIRSPKSFCPKAKW